MEEINLDGAERGEEAATSEVQELGLVAGNKDNFCQIVIVRPKKCPLLGINLPLTLARQLGVGVHARNPSLLGSQGRRMANLNLAWTT